MQNFLLQVQNQPGEGQLPRFVPLPGQQGPAYDAYLSFGDLALGPMDLTLLVLCPICAALGVLVSFIIKEQEIAAKHSGLKRFFHQIGTYTGNLFIGLVLGFVVALFFVGAIKPEVTSLARVLALSILLGYQARHLWFSQEFVIKKLIDKRIKDTIDSESHNNAWLRENR